MLGQNDNCALCFLVRVAWVVNRIDRRLGAERDDRDGERERGGLRKAAKAAITQRRRENAQSRFVARRRSDCRAEDAALSRNADSDHRVRNFVAAMTSLRRRRALGALALLAQAVVSPAALRAAERDTTPSSPTEYRGTGVVLALLPPPSDLHATRPVIIIKHDPIHGLMDERMSMPFIAASTDLFRGVTVGERIGFTLRETPDALLVVGIERKPSPPAR